MNPATAIPGFICGYIFASDGTSKPIDEIQFSLGTDDQWLWLHLNLTDQRCARWIETHVNLPESLIGEFCAHSRRQHLSARDNCWVGHLGDFRHEFAQVGNESTILHMILSTKILITGRVQGLQSAERLRNDIKLGKSFTSPLTMLCGIVVNYVDEVENLHNGFLDEMEKIEDQILFDRHRSERRRLM